MPITTTASDDYRMAILGNMVRRGTIVSIDSEYNTAVVNVPEIVVRHYSDSNDTLAVNMVNRTVKVLNRGSKSVKDYFNYEVGEPVLCIFPATVSGSYLSVDNTGYIVGSFFDFDSTDRKPPAYYDKIRTIDFGGGNYIEVNLEENYLDINFKGAIYICGKELYLNG